MDDDLKQFEAELKRLRPVEPSRELTARIAADLPAPAQAARREESAGRPHPLWWAWVTLPAAAAAAVALVFFTRHPTETPQTVTAVASATPVRADRPAFKPVSAENLLIEAKDEGLVTLPDGSAARRVRQSYIDTIVWKDPASQASLRWSVPREEERVVPVVFQ